MARHIIVGAGAVGAGTALHLADAGHDVVVVTRSGGGPDHERIQLVAADAGDTSRLTELATGAHALYNCANPPYDKWAEAWPPLAASMLGAAETTGARLVTMGNLYVYAKGSSPMSATDELSPPSKKGAIREAMWNDAVAAHRAGRVRITEARASDFVGPGIGESGHLGDRTVPRLLAGKNVSTVGRVDVVHSWSYIDDVCRTLATLGTDDRALGRAWHVPTGPAISTQAIVTRMCEVAEVQPVKVKRLPTIALRAAGIFNPVIRELPEMLYQFDEPFVIDATETTETFGLTATPLDDQLRATIDFYRGLERDPAADAGAATLRT